MNVGKPSPLNSDCPLIAQQLYLGTEISPHAETVCMGAVVRVYIYVYM